MFFFFFSTFILQLHPTLLNMRSIKYLIIFFDFLDGSFLSSSWLIHSLPFWCLWSSYSKITWYCALNCFCSLLTWVLAPINSHPHWFFTYVRKKNTRKMFCFGKVLSHLSKDRQLKFRVTLNIIYFVQISASFPQLETIYSHSGKWKPPKLKQVKEIIIII